MGPHWGAHLGKSEIVHIEDNWNGTRFWIQAQFSASLPYTLQAQLVQSSMDHWATSACNKLKATMWRERWSSEGRDGL